MQHFEVENQSSFRLPAPAWLTKRVVAVVAVTAAVAGVLVGLGLSGQGSKEGEELRSTLQHMQGATHVCQLHREQLSGSVPDSSLPQCEADGTYGAVQCSGPEGEQKCGCATASGEWLGTPRTKQAEPKAYDPASCEKLRAGCLGLGAAHTRGNSMSCAENARKEKIKGLVGAHVPQCADDGTYIPRQCWGSTGECWCSDAAGVIVSGTKRGPTEPNVSSDDCESLLSTCGESSACQRAQQEATRAFADFIPRCYEHSFAPKQCLNSTAECWCVDDKGKELPSSRSANSMTDQDCIMKRSLTSPRSTCEEEVKAHVMRGLVGTPIPVCMPDGSFGAKQCEFRTVGVVVCWCATRNGRELDGTRTAEDLSTEHCEDELKKSTHVRTSCEKSHEDALASLQPGMVGKFLPVCHKDGTFKKRQCHASTGQCWCVDAEGSERHATRGRPGPEDQDTCEKLQTQCVAGLADPCHVPPSSMGQCLVAESKYFFNITSGKCESHTVVCKGSGNNFASESDCTDKCSLHGDSTCLAQLAAAKNLEAKGLLGTFHPRCTDDGRWKALQCQGGVYGCWCVDHYGQPFPATSHGLLNSGSDGVEDVEETCADLRQSCTPCEDTAQERCTVQHQAAGNNCAVGACIATSSTKALV